MFEGNLLLALLALRIKIAPSLSTFVMMMWQLLIQFAGDIDPQYTTSVKQVADARNKYVHGVGRSYTAEDFEELINHLAIL